MLDMQTGELLGALPVRGANVVSDDGQKILVATTTNFAKSFELRCNDATTLQQIGAGSVPFPTAYTWQDNQALELDLLGAHGLSLRGASSLLLFTDARTTISGC